MCKLCQLCVCKTLPAVCKSCVCKCCQLCMCVVCKHYQLCVYLVSTSRVSEWLSESVRVCKEKYRTGVEQMSKSDWISSATVSDASSPLNLQRVIRAARVDKRTPPSRRRLALHESLRVSRYHRNLWFAFFFFYLEKTCQVEIYI